MDSKEMSKRIKDLRKEKGLTLEQVAKVVGVGRSTVRKWETGMIANMKRDKIASLANAIGTTPAYLMGWKEDTPLEKQKTPNKQELTEGEQMMLDLFNKIPEDQQPMVIEMIRVALKMKK